MSKPTNCITVTEAKELQKNWNDTRAVDIERAMGSKDCCAVTFNINQLQEFFENNNIHRLNFNSFYKISLSNINSFS